MKLQLVAATFFLLLCTSFLLAIIISPNNNWFDTIISYHQDSLTMRACGIAVLCLDTLPLNQKLIIKTISRKHICLKVQMIYIQSVTKSGNSTVALDAINRPQSHHNGRSFLCHYTVRGGYFCHRLRSPP